MTSRPAILLPSAPWAAIRRVLEALAEPPDPGMAMRQLVDAGCDHLPLPGSGATLARWQALARVAAVDLSLVKLYEGHTDALAIFAELGLAPDAPLGSRWGVWCAEPPEYRVALVPQPDGSARLRGGKAWCSGAATISHALVSAWDPAGEPCLAAVALDQPGVTVTNDGWHAVGMRASASVNVVFDDALCQPVGAPGAYVNRPGFLHGGAGVAACWYGGLTRIASTLWAATRAQNADPENTNPGTENPHRLAHLGAIDVAMVQARAVLRDTAAFIDANPADACALACARARLAVEAAATEVITRAGRALGAGPLCRDAGFAQVMADLPVFIRQSHAERDQAALGRLVRNQEETPWQL
ncbi:acyl-CoA dehydrogenase [Achromobacter spanius]|uniref:acyl-CoA dehydrogenase n=1 Tax=Achromobacter spanius TaxID=217203 RepID=UPI0036F0571D